MSLRSLNAQDRDIVLKCLSATFEYFDFDFEARLSVDPDTMRRLIADWPNIDDSDDDGDAALAINNALNDLLHGTGVSDADFIRLTGVGRVDIDRVYQTWATGRGWTSSGVR